MNLSLSYSMLYLFSKNNFFSARALENAVQMKSLTVLIKPTLLFQVMGVVFIYHQASLKALARLTLHGFPLTIKNVISSLVAGPTMVGRYSAVVASTSL